MSNIYRRIPGVDDGYAFSPEVRRAFADSPELTEAIARDVAIVLPEAMASDPTIAAAGAEAARDAVAEELLDAGIVKAPAVPSPSGQDLVVRAQNGVVTWLQAVGILSPGQSIAGPTPAAVESMAAAGMVTVVVGTPPESLDLPAGQVRIYLNDGEPVLAIGM